MTPIIVVVVWVTMSRSVLPHHELDSVFQKLKMPKVYNLFQIRSHVLILSQTYEIILISNNSLSLLFIYVILNNNRATKKKEKLLIKLYVSRK